jgi:hypothetical protein
LTSMSENYPSFLYLLLYSGLQVKTLPVRMRTNNLRHLIVTVQKVS